MQRDSVQRGGSARAARPGLCDVLGGRGEAHQTGRETDPLVPPSGSDACCPIDKYQRHQYSMSGSSVRGLTQKSEWINSDPPCCRVATASLTVILAVDADELKTDQFDATGVARGVTMQGQSSRWAKQGKRETYLSLASSELSTAAAPSALWSTPSTACTGALESTSVIPYRTEQYTKERRL